MSLLSQLIFSSNNSTDAVLITDAMVERPGPNIVYCNQRFTEATGYTLEELQGKSPRILQGPGSNTEVLVELREALLNKTNFRGRSVNYHKNGTPLEVEWSIVPIYNEGEEVVYYFSSQQYLVLSNARRTHLHHLAHGLLNIEDNSFFTGICEKIVKHACVELAAIASHDDHEMVTLGSCISGHEEGFDVFVFEPALAARWEGEPMDIVRDMEWLDTCPWLKAFMDTFSLHVLKIFPVTFSGRPSACLIIGHRLLIDHSLPIEDLFNLVSSRLELEFELIARQREIATLQNQLFEAHKMELVGRLASSVAHEFNNILTSIQGFSQGVLDSANLNPTEREDLEKVIEATHTGVETTSRLLFMGRRNLPRSGQINPAEIMALESSIHRAAGKEMYLVFDFEETPKMLEGDLDAFRQILVNLCLNAQAASNTGDVIQIIGRKSGPGYVIEVTDHGCGMDSETAARSIEPFFSTKTLGQSIGLGLSTVCGLTQQMEGEVQVESELKKGTTVRLTFPLHDPLPTVEIEEVPLSEEPAEPRGPVRILIVEDNISIRNLALRVLKREGYEVLQYASAEDVISAEAEHGWDVDLMVTDVMMAQITGIELSHHVREVRPDLPIVLMTGFSEEILVTGSMLPDTQVMRKPFFPNDLKTMVAKVLAT